jgi:hypothetical protein
MPCPYLRVTDIGQMAMSFLCPGISITMAYSHFNVMRLRIGRQARLNTAFSPIPATVLDIP